MTQFAKRSATTMFIIGGLAIVFGIIAIFAPAATGLSLVILWGAYALVDGIISAVLVFRRESASARGLLIVNAILGIIAGIFVLTQPVAGAQVLGWVLAFWLILRGILEFIAAFASETGGPRWLQLIAGVLFVLAGILFLANPGAAVLTFALWLGILALIWGVMLIVAGMNARKAAKESESAGN